MSQGIIKQKPNPSTSSRNKEKNITGFYTELGPREFQPRFQGFLSLSAELSKNKRLPFIRARFSKVPRLFERISGDIILFVSSKRRRLEKRNFAVILTYMNTPTLQIKPVGVSRMAFRARDFRETRSRAELFQVGLALHDNL